MKENILFRFVLVIIATGVIVFTDLTSTLTNSQQGSFFLKIISITILAQWIFELILTNYEIEKKTLKLVFINLINIFFSISLLFSLLFLNIYVISIIFCATYHI